MGSASYKLLNVKVILIAVVCLILVDVFVGASLGDGMHTMMSSRVSNIDAQYNMMLK